MVCNMICLDIDGTILNSRHEITSHTRTVIRAASKRGIPVVLISARMPKAMVFLKDELGLKDPIACYGGGLILAGDGTVIESKTLETPLVWEVSRLADSMGIHVSYYRNDEWCVDEMDEWARQEGLITHYMATVCDTEAMMDRWEADGTGPHKLLLTAEADRILAFMKQFEREGWPQMEVYRSKDTYLEVMPAGVGKKETVERLCRLYGILKEQVLAAWDNDNDISMIQYAGMGVAMGNAREEVKKYADFVTLSNDEDGVAYAIEKYVFD